MDAVRKRSSPRFIDGETMRRVSDFVSLTGALYEAHRERMEFDPELLLSRPIEGGFNAFNLLPAWQDGKVIGAKLVTFFPDNPTHGIPSAQGIVVVFDGQTGTPTAIVDGTELTVWKTAGDSALGSRLLSRPDSHTLLMVGAGGLAYYAVTAHLSVRPSLRHVFLWNRRPGRAQELKRMLVDSPFGTGRTFEVVENIDEVVPRADIICCATMAETPLVHGRLLSPGTHVALIGGWTPRMREVDSEAVVRATLFANERRNALRCGDLTIPIDEGLITADSIKADLFDLCSGAQGRQSDDEITLYKNSGGGHLDLFTANYVLDRVASETAGASPKTG